MVAYTMELLQFCYNFIVFCLYLYMSPFLLFVVLFPICRIRRNNDLDRYGFVATRIRVVSATVELESETQSVKEKAPLPLRTAQHFLQRTSAGSCRVCLHEHSSLSDGATGREISTIVPSPTLLETHMLPSSSFTRFLVILRPSPDPECPSISSSCSC